MAYVPVTEKLINETKHNINCLCGAELAQMPDEGSAPGEKLQFGQYVEQRLLPRILDTMWGEYADLRQRLEPLNVLASVTFQVKRVAEDGYATQLASQFKAKIPVVAVSATKDYYSSAICVAVDASIEQYPELAPYLTVIDDRKDVSRRWEKVRGEVVAFIRNCKSLNEAVKLWPDVIRYVPREYKQRLEQTVQRATKAQNETNAALEALKNIDVDAAKASLVLARMAGAEV